MGAIHDLLFSPSYILNILIVVFSVILIFVLVMIFGIGGGKRRRPRGTLLIGASMFIGFVSFVALAAVIFSYGYFNNIRKEPHDPPHIPSEVVLEKMDRPDAGASNLSQESQNVEAQEEKQLNGANTVALGRELKNIEINLRIQIEQDEKEIAEVGAKYKRGEIDTAAQLMDRAQLEIDKRNHIIDAMDEKISLIENSELLEHSMKSKALEGNISRRNHAIDERRDYESVLFQVRAHKEEYNNM